MHRLSEKPSDDGANGEEGQKADDVGGLFPGVHRVNIEVPTRKGVDGAKGVGESKRFKRNGKREDGQ